MSEHPLVSVVITGLNEEYNIKNCIHSILFSQSYPNYEVTYVDGGSSDRTMEIIESIMKNAPGPVASKIKIVKDIRSTPSKARNTGITCSNGDIIAFLDADCVAPNNWLQRLVETFKKTGDKIGGIGGPYAIPEQATKKTFIIFRALNTPFGGNILTVQFVHEASGTKIVNAVPAGNSAYWRKILEKVGGFNPDLRYCEDHDLCRRIIAEPRKAILFDPKLYVFHYSKVTGFSSLFRLMYNYGAGRVDAYFTERKLFSGTRMLPAFSILLFFSLIFAGVFSSIFLTVVFYLVLIYIAIALASSVYLVMERKGISYMLAFFVYPTAHISYGLGTIVSLIKNVVLYAKRKLQK
jgi:glycosyltransferase involved in cell wall biosynthesis